MTGRGVLCGRSAELDRLWARCEEAAAGRGGLVVVSGEAGIGKSHLVADLADRATAAAFAVGSGEATPLSGHPFEPILRALRIEEGGGGEAQERVRSLLDLPDRAERSVIGWTASAQAHLLDALCVVASDAAATRPLLLLVEDLHWSAQATLVALARLHALAQEHRIVVVATTRPNAPEETLRGIRAISDLGAETLELGPLDDDAIGDLVVELVGAPPGERLLGRLIETGGNPLFVTELVRGLLAEGAIEIVAGRAETSVDTVPPTLAAQVVRKIDDLPEAAREVVCLGAVLGRSFVPGDLAIASGRPATALLAPIDEAMRAGLLVDGGDRLSFRHELVRSVVYDRMPRAVRLSIHRQVASALVAEGASPHRVAAHYLIAGEPGDRRAIDVLTAAARSVTATAPNEAIEMFDRAIELEGELDRRVAILADRLEALALSGRVGEAQAQAREIIHLLADGPERRDVQLDLARVLLIGNQADEAAAIFEEVASADDRRRPLALAEASLCALAAGQPDRAQRNAAEALVACESIDADRSAASLALSMQSRLAVHEYEFETSAVIAKRAVDLADASPRLEGHRYQPLFFLGLTLHDLERYDELLDVLDTGRGVARRLGHTFGVPLYDALEAFTHLRAGRVDAAVTLADASIRGCAEVESALALAYAHAVRAVASLHRGDVEGAAASVAAGERASEEAPPLLGSDVLILASSMLHEATGEPARALELLLGGFALFDGIGLPHMAAAFVGDLVRLAASVGDPSMCTDAVALVERGATKLDLASWHGGVLEARGILECDPDLLCEAATVYARSPRRLLEARALELGGAMFAERADDRAVPVLTLAFDLYDACGASRDRSRVASELRAVGARPRRAPTRGRAGELLSPKEREVVELVATGLSNTEIATRLFVSKRTIESHLRRIFVKLDVSSRLELVLAVNREAATTL